MALKTNEIKLNILRTIGEAERYGYEIHKILETQEKEIEIARLYKVLKDMLTEGTLTCRWEKSKMGPEKRVYKLAEKGRTELTKILQEAIITVHDHYIEYLLNLPTENSVLESFARMAAPVLKKESKIAFFAPRISRIHERLLIAIQKRLTKSEVFIVLPEIDANSGSMGTISLRGNYDTIPLRSKYVDLLILDGLPSQSNSSKAVEEWQRVLKEKGTVVLIVPRAAFSALKDPLTIGDFLEKMEHQSSDGRKTGNGETLQRLLEEYFMEVQKEEMLHMTFLIAREPRPAFQATPG